MQMKRNKANPKLCPGIFTATPLSSEMRVGPGQTAYSSLSSATLPINAWPLALTARLTAGPDDDTVYPPGHPSSTTTVVLS